MPLPLPPPLPLSLPPSSPRRHGVATDHPSARVDGLDAVHVGAAWRNALVLELTLASTTAGLGASHDLKGARGAVSATDAER